MPLVFPYYLYTAADPVWSLGGRLGRPRPVVEIGVEGPNGTRVVPALIDTGADDTVFSMTTAIAIGVDLTNAQLGGASGVGMVGAPIWFTVVHLRLSDGREFRDWPARVGFTSAPLKRGLLGFAGVLQYFTATFDGERERVTLDANARYPGT